MTRAGGLIAALFIFSVLVGSLALIPFLLVGAWKRRRDATFGPYFGYAALLFAFSALVSAVHVPGGTFIHSAVALAPHGYVLALLGVVASVSWIAARRERWDAERASRVFVTGAVVFGVVTAVWGSSTVHASWDEKRQRFLALNEAIALARLDPTDRVMSIDASGTKYWTGHGGVVLVNDPIETVEAVARAYDIRWLARGAPPTPFRRRQPSWQADARLARLPRRGERGQVLGLLPCAPRPRGTDRWRDRGMNARAWLTALGIFVFALAVRAVAASRCTFPRARGHGVLRRRRPEPRRGTRAGLRRAVELRHAAAGVPATGVRGLAAAAVVPRRAAHRPVRRPRPDSSRDAARRARRCWSGRSSSGPRLAARGGRGRGARAARRAALARWRSAPA